jgi:hypothetical protein
MTASDHLAPQALASLELFQDLPSAALDDVLTSALALYRGWCSREGAKMDPRQ